jgi:hypothetical protein
MRRRSVPRHDDTLPFGCMPGGELREEGLHASGVEPRQDEPEDSTRARVRRRVEPEPFVAHVDFGDRALALRRPDAAQDGLEAKAGLVLAPDLHLVFRMFDSQGLRRLR